MFFFKDSIDMKKKENNGKKALCDFSNSCLTTSALFKEVYTNGVFN